MAAFTFRAGGDGDRSGAPPGPSTAVVDLERRITGFTAGLSARGGYRPPDRTERTAVADGVGLLLDGDRDGAARRLAEVGFQVRAFTDRATGRPVAEVFDGADSGDAIRGWGRVYVDLAAPVRWSVQVPHPAADLDTERLGTAVWRGTPGGVLVLAGAHRRAGQDGEADVAHRRDSVFHAVCAELVRRGLPGMQLHGFANDSAPDHEAIVSTGAGDAALPEARVLARALRDREVEVCRAWARSCSLEGRTNRQGRTAAESDVPFLHLEFNRDLRADGTGRARLAAALSGTAADWR
ncbi:hypothetical protein V1J52_15240 [Streptomyces sp. TRM 70351]|uniref:hypothetical protein n=1 Tax=Streptomyces sp. TRM 70351 TaxID=3116552 RepID=UPI002E7C24A8|nr:hypothetical protein [Streptomyces sp. TRM 70351]MEE1929521.1 hypothetical protein [Streptomyces sp. TRM 70351]